MTDTMVEGLAAVMERHRTFQQHGALRGEGGERAFRGWLVGAVLYGTLGWPWHRVVFGESMDLLLLDWRDFPVIYVETKSPSDDLRPQHRAEMETRLHRWGSLRHVFLTNGREWERFDHTEVPLGEPNHRYRIEDGARGAADFFAPLESRRYLR
jgi:hypothetical protein